jgi:RND family efflux transporter MFP subunit
MSSCNKKEQKQVKPSVRVETEVISDHAGRAGRSYVGIVEEREGTAVSFTGMGVVKRVFVNEGQPVRRGQLIAEMDDTQARNLLSGAEASMTQANDALERMKMLHDNGSLPEMQWVEVQSRVAQARSQLAVARKNLSDCRLVAPVSGIVGRKQVGAGETALPSQAVVTILDISSVKVKVAVPEAEISSITPSTPSSISVEAAQKQVSGGRIEKGVQADAITHTYDVRIHVANADRKLLPGMVASVRLLTEGSHAITRKSLPVTAVQKAADGSLFVWTVAADSTAHRSKISIGKTHNNQVAVSEGLDIGQRVVTEGYQKLSEGTKVVF